MNKWKFADTGIAIALACALLVVPMIAGSSNRGTEPAASSDAMPAMGQALLMKFKVLNQSAQETTYAVIFGARLSQPAGTCPSGAPTGRAPRATTKTSRISCQRIPIIGSKRGILTTHICL